MQVSNVQLTSKGLKVFCTTRCPSFASILQAQTVAEQKKEKRKQNKTKKKLFKHLTATSANLLIPFINSSTFLIQKLF